MVSYYIRGSGKKSNDYSLKGFTPGLIISTLSFFNIMLLKFRSVTCSARHHSNSILCLRTYYLLLHIILVIATIFVKVITNTGHCADQLHTSPCSSSQSYELNIVIYISQMKKMSLKGFRYITQGYTLITGKNPDWNPGLTPNH